MKEKLEQKKEQLKNLVAKFQQEQQNSQKFLNELSQQILETNGAIKQLEELINEEDKGEK